MDSKTKIFELNKDTINDLINISNQIINSKIDTLIILIDKNNIDFSKIKFIHSIIINFYINNKKIGIWGIPNCVLRNILTPKDFIKLYDYLIKPNYNLNKKTKKLIYYSSNIIECRNCIENKDCIGLGNLKTNQYPWLYIQSGEYIFNKYYKNIIFQDKEIDKHFKTFSNHIKNYKSIFSTRSIYFANTISNETEFKYNNRFIYYCHNLHKSEINNEINNLKKISNNETLINELEIFYKNFILNGFAYSYAKGDKTRESIYYFPINSNIIKSYLSKIPINFEELYFEELYFIGIDYIKNKKYEIKIYSKIKNNSELLKYLKEKYKIKINNNVLNYISNLIFVRRYNLENKKLKSIKIEYNINNNEKYSQYLKNEFNYDINYKEFEKIIRLTFNYNLEKKIGVFNKITKYYR